MIHLLEPFPQLEQAPPDVTLDRAEWKSEGVRDVVVRPVLEEGHPDHRGAWVAHPLELVDDEEALGPVAVVRDRRCRRRIEGHGLQVPVVAVLARVAIVVVLPLTFLRISSAVLLILAQ